MQVSSVKMRLFISMQYYKLSLKRTYCKLLFLI
jgi:hypothetical protein